MMEKFSKFEKIRCHEDESISSFRTGLSGQRSHPESAAFDQRAFVVKKDTLRSRSCTLLTSSPLPIHYCQPFVLEPINSVVYYMMIKH